MARYWSQLNLASKVLVLTIPVILVGMGGLTSWLASGMRGDLESRLRDRGIVIQKQIEVTRGYLATQYVGKIKAAGQGIIKVGQDHSAPDTVPLPATATREMSEQLSQLGIYTARVISQTPLNPANRPQDPFEEDALRSLAAGSAESIRIEPVNGVLMFRRMTPDIISSQACINCHIDKKMGDMVGAVSVQIPMEKPLSDVDHKVIVLYAVGAIGAIILAAILYLLLRHLVILPLAALSGAVQEIAAGRYATRAAVTTQDEVGQLAQAFNQMGENIQSSTTKSQELACTLNNAQANILMVDRNLVITYVNEGAIKTFRKLDADIRKFLPKFDANKLVGTCIDDFHKDPLRIRKILDHPRNMPHRADIQIGPITLDLMVDAIRTEDGTHTGNSLEWVDVTQSRKLAVEMARLSTGLDNTNVNVMICDRNYEVVYMNKMSAATLRRAEPLIQQGLPSFRADKVIGSCIDQYHKVPSAIRQILDNPQNLPRRSEIKVGALTLDLTASAIMNAKGEYLGNVVEWTDVTGQKRAQSEVDRLIAAASAGQLSERINAEEFEGFFKTLSQGVNKMLAAVVAPLHEAQGVLTALAANDLTQQMTGMYEGEFEQMKTSLNAAITNLTATLATVRSAAESVSTGAEEITNGNEDLSQRTSEQASSLEETSSAMEEMTSAVKQSADNAKQANQLALAAREVAEKGGSVTTQAIDAMGEINKSSKKIADIITVIDEIAFQTNLLALNAAVEAARAGEHGRGFAVVAAEVRNLAQRSATAAKEIKGLINESVQRVTDGSELVNQSGKTLTEIVGSVKRVTDIIAGISAASQEQASGIDQVNKAIMEMDQTTQQNAALVEEATSASQSMKEQAQELTRQVSSFKLTQTGPGQQPAVVPVSQRPSGLSAGPVKKPLLKKPAAPSRANARQEFGSVAPTQDRQFKGGEFEEF